MSQLDANERAALRRLYAFLADTGVSEADRVVLAKVLADTGQHRDTSIVDFPRVRVGKRCHRCHHGVPNPEGCAECNPVRLGERLKLALSELALIKHHKRFYVLVRVRVSVVNVINDGPELRYQPLWWTIADHNGCDHATDGKQFTLAITSIDAPTLHAAREQFQAQANFWMPLINTVGTHVPDDWAGEIDSEQHDEMMAGYYMARLDARKQGKPVPEAPRVLQPNHRGLRCPRRWGTDLENLNQCDSVRGHTGPCGPATVPVASPPRCTGLFEILVDHGGFDLNHPMQCELVAGHAGPHDRGFCGASYERQHNGSTMTSTHYCRRARGHAGEHGDTW